MPSSDFDDDEAAPARPKKTTTPKRSPAVRRPANATPMGKAPADKAGTPNSAPVRARPSMKKAEPTLFADFLLGRPSASRPRRKSLDVVPMEMKRSAVGRVQAPGGVKERVKQWQKASAAAVVEDILEPPNKPDDLFLQLDDESVTERDRRRIKFRKNHTQRPGRRKIGDQDSPATPIKSVSSPRKRVVSDDYWMANKEKRSPPRTPKTVEEPLSKGQMLPKDFLKNSTNPPLEKKIEDWNKRTITDEEDRKDKQPKKASKTVSKDIEHGRIPSRAESPDRGIRVRPIKENLDLDTRLEKPVHCHESRKGRQRDTEDFKSSRRRSGNYRDRLPVVKESPQSRNPNAVVIDTEEESNSSCETPTRPQRSKNRQRKSVSPESLADIPVGYSAFSVLEITVGGDGSKTRPLKPQRQPSLSTVPKVLKKVYAEGMKKVHDAVDPPRIGVNQPPSIESWLNGTSDPFVDEVHTPEALFEIEKPRPRQQNYEKETSYQGHDTRENEDHDLGVAEQTSKGIQAFKIGVEDSPGTHQARKLSVGMRTSSERMVGERSAESISPVGLKRSPAARHTSPPKTARHTPPSDVVVDSCNGQPQPVPKGRSPSLSAKGSELRNEAKRSTEGARWDSEGRHYEFHYDTQESPSPRSPQTPQTLDATYQKSLDVLEPSSCKTSTQWDRTATGKRRLSTIASVETFKSSSLTETSSELSDTTVTQTTVTQNTSRTSNTSNASHTGDKVLNPRSNNYGLKRRLTKHSDLLSVLSLPDASVPGGTKGIKSARSIRTARTRLDTATITDLLRELADDEVKYMRELKTLVDGVVPVLLSCVLSKSDSAVATGLFRQKSSGETDAFVTKPIVDMGIALEKLKSFHKRIPLHDSELLIHWASGAHKAYEDYVDAWRMGFQNLIVNLAPAAGPSSAQDQSQDEMPRNEDGDVLNENGERVDVAFLLKRPLVRVKYLAKVMKGINTIKPREQAARANDQYQELLTKIRRRTREEDARLEDQAASSTDATRARDPRTLGPLESVTIDPTRQVFAKDFFDFGISHSSGQRVDCRVELLFRDKPHDKSDAGDVLICEVDNISRWLLFPPIELDRISARAGNSARELLVMVRGTEGSKSWYELFTLISTDDETAAEWIQMLGVSPRPSNLRHEEGPSVPILSLLPNVKSAESHQNGSSSPRSSTLPDPSETDVPIGERHRKYERSRPSKTYSGERTASTKKSSPSSPQYGSRVESEKNSFSEDKLRDLNDAMERAGTAASSELRRMKAKRYHSQDTSHSPEAPISEGLARSNDANIQHRYESTHSPSRKSHTSRPEDLDLTNPRLHPAKLPPGEMPPIPKHRKSPQKVENIDKSLPLDDSIRPDDPFKREHALLPSKKDLGNKNDPPPPPPHKNASPAVLKPSLVLAKPTSTAKTRRFSSPLKHEYQPSSTSDVSSASDESDPGEFGDSSDSSEEELEAVDPIITPPDPGRRHNKVSPPGSAYSWLSASLAPSNSASQAPHSGARLESKIETTKVVATISCWSDKGRWVDLHPQDCTVVVGPGLIEAYAMSAYLSSDTAGSESEFSSSSSSDANTNKDAGAMRPLVSLELTPIVPLRQSNALDIEIRSPPTAKSSVDCTHTVRFRSRTLKECSALYAAIHKARMENPVYMKLEQERIVNAYGKQLLEETAGSNRRRSWFGRSKSYRASARAPSDTVSDNSSNSIATAISRLRSMGVIGAFNIEKSSVGTSHDGPSGTSSGATSVYTGSTNSASSGVTPPRSPSSPGTALTGTSNVVSFGSSDLKIRLYLNVTPSKWSDFGGALLTVTHPPRGMRQASSLYHGVEKRIIVTKKEGPKQTLSKKIQGPGSPKGEELGAVQVILDTVLGGACFSRQGVVGIVMNVWEDIKGDNGEVGKVAAIGGVSGRTRRWMFHFASAAETAWVFSLVGGGVR